MMSSKPTVFVVDDDPADREALARIVETIQLRSVSFTSAEEFLEVCDSSQPGCLILDLRLPGMNGLDLQQRLTEEGIEIPVIILSAYGDVRSSVRAMQQGAVTFLEKPCNTDLLCENIIKAVKLDAELRAIQARRAEMVSKVAQLTIKERDVMELIVLGKADKVIASELDISLRTVQFRKASILKKTGVLSWAALVELVLSVRNSPEN